MGLTRCYKAEGFFYIDICSFSTIFYAISISDTCLRRSKSISIPNLNEISQSIAEIKLLPVSKNGRPPYWNSTSGSDFDVHVCAVNGISFSICLSNFVVIGRFAEKLRRHIDFSTWRPQNRKCTSRCKFSDGICLRRW